MSDKLAVVSGGSKGIGKAIINKFASGGFDIATFSRNEDQLAKLKEDIESKYGISLYYEVVDASSKKAVIDFGKNLGALDKRVEVIVHNAGMFEPGSVLDEEEGVLERTLKTNLESAYHLSRVLIPEMKLRKKGHVFTICSTASIMGYPNGGSYSISKFGLLGMTKTLREELKEHNVRVTAVLPGATFTSSWEGAGFPESRFMKVEDIADVVYSTYSLSENTNVEEILLRPQLGDI